MRRRLPVLLGLVAIISACTSLTPGPSAQLSEEAVLDLVRGIRVEARVSDVGLVAAGATADFGVQEGLRRVVIRVVDQLRVEVSIVSTSDLVLAESPGLCLVGPFWNPLDAGLSDRCWGTPDLGGVASDQLPTEPDGTIVLPAGAQVAVGAVLDRGHDRCDYAPGEWHLEVTVSPVAGGQAFGPIRLPNAPVTVPFDAVESVNLLPPGDSRVCSYAAAVVLAQGEPELSTPRPQ